MRSMFYVAAAAALVAGAPASAQNFEGVRAEARVGWNRIKLNGAFADGTDTLRASGSDNGVSYGAEVGYDKMVRNNLLLGLYGTLDFANNKSCSEVFGLDQGCLKARRNIALGGRVGATFADSVLVYAKGGYSNGRLGISYNDQEGLLESFDVGRNRNGFHLGLGGESIITSRIYGKLEYVYSRYSRSRFSADEFEVSARAQRHQVLAGVGVRF